MYFLKLKLLFILTGILISYPIYGSSLLEISQGKYIIQDQSWTQNYDTFVKDLENALLSGKEKNIETIDFFGKKNDTDNVFPKALLKFPRLKYLTINSLNLVNVNLDNDLSLNLKEISLSNNRINYLPGNIKNYKKLEGIDLSRNPLRSLPIEILMLPALDKLMLSNLVEESLIPFEDNVKFKSKVIPVARKVFDEEIENRQIFNINQNITYFKSNNEFDPVTDAHAFFSLGIIRDWLIQNGEFEKCQKILDKITHLERLRFHENTNNWDKTEVEEMGNFSSNNEHIPLDIYIEVFDILGPNDYLNTLFVSHFYSHALYRINKILINRNYTELFDILDPFLDDVWIYFSSEIKTLLNSVEVMYNQKKYLNDFDVKLANLLNNYKKNSKKNNRVNLRSILNLLNYHD